MAELQVLMQSNGAFKSELLKSFLSSSRGSSTSSSIHSTTGTTGSPGVGGNINTASPITSSLTSTTTADVNLNMAPSQFVGGNINNMPQNLNGNTAFSSTGNVNLTSPRIIPSSLDNSGSSTTTTATNPSSTTTLGSSPKTGATPNLNLNTAANINTTAAATQKVDNINKNLNSASTTSGQSQTDQTTTKGPFDDVIMNPEFVSRAMNDVKRTLNETGNLLTTQVTDAIVEAHFETTINTYANVAEANERLAHQKMPAEMPDMSKLSINPSMMWQQFMKSMVPEITKVVKFTKKLPGFSEVQPQDQMMMIKQGCFEVMIARFCILIDTVKEEMFDPCLKMKSPRRMVKELPMGVFMDEFFDIAKLVNPLELTDGEIGLFTAILMFSPDRPGLSDVTSIALIQQLYLQSLYSLMKQSHKDADQTFSTLIGLIPIFKKINEDHIKFINSMKSQMPGGPNVQFPPLHTDIFGEDSSPSSTSS